MAPSISSKVIVKIVKAVVEDSRLREEMRNAPKIYGTNVSEKIVKVVKRTIGEHSPRPFNIFEFLEHDRLRLSKQSF